MSKSRMVLNDQQVRAVKYNSGPLAIIASPGSGKTATLTVKLLYLLKKKKVNPQSILVCTFTTKAAEELKERVGKSVGFMQGLKIGTIHSYCYGVCMRYNGRQKLVVDGHKYAILAKIIKSQDLGIRNIYELISKIGKWKNSGLLPEDVIEQNKHAMTGTVKNNATYASILAYKYYEDTLKATRMVDFDSMLLNTYCMFNRKPSILKKEASRLEYILLDEMHDSSGVQFKIIQQLTSQKAKLTSVGDLSQLIYSFRCASIVNTTNFIEATNSRIFYLNQNYRSTQTIVEASNKLIAHNNSKYSINAVTSNEVGNPIQVILPKDECHESVIILDKIKQYLEQGYNYSDIFILYRVNAQSRSFIDIFMQHEIPYSVTEKNSFYTRKEILDVMAYIEIAMNPFETKFNTFARIANRPTRYMPNTGMDKLKSFAKKKSLSIMEALANVDVMPSLTPTERSGLNKLYNDIHSLLGQVGKDATSFLNYLLHTMGYAKFIIDNAKESEDFDSETYIESLISMGQGHASIESLINHYKKIKKKEKKSEQVANSIQLLTVHAAKGQEAPIVFIAGFSEGIFPHRKSGTEEGIQEERRVAYVALTRAKKEVIISALTERYGRFKVRPSRFINNMGINPYKGDQECKL